MPESSSYSERLDARSQPDVSAYTRANRLANDAALSPTMNHLLRERYTLDSALRIRRASNEGVPALGRPPLNTEGDER